jgi:hypothetical protein
MLKRLAPFALVLLAACAKNKVQPPPGSGETAPGVAATKSTIKVNGTELAEVDVVAIAGEKQVAADSPDAIDAAIDLYLLRDYAKMHDVAAPTESAGLMDEGTQLEARIFDKAPPPPPGDEPYITVDHAYVFLDKIAKKPEKKKARASAEAFRKAAAADPAKTFASIFALPTLKPVPALTHLQRTARTLGCSRRVTALQAPRHRFVPTVTARH